MPRIDRRLLGWGLLAALVGAALAAALTFVVAGMRQRPVASRGSSGRPSGGVLLGLLDHVVDLLAHLRGVADLGDRRQRHRGRNARGRLAGKLVASAVCLTTGWGGGFIIPRFFVGAAAGQLLHITLPSVDATALMAAYMHLIASQPTRAPSTATAS